MEIGRMPHQRNYRTSHLPLDAVFKSIGLSESLHELGEPASPQTIASAEKKLGRSLPKALRAIYEFSDGCGLVRGNCIFDSLIGTGEKLGFVVENTHAAIENGGPREMIVFGGNGSDDQFGIWSAKCEQAATSNPIIEIGDFDPHRLAVAGTDLVRFMVGRLAFYLILYHQDGRIGADALVALGVPHSLWNAELDDGLVVAVTSWADPTLQDPDPDPYTKPISASQLCERYGSD